MREISFNFTHWASNKTLEASVFFSNSNHITPYFSSNVLFMLLADQPKGSSYRIKMSKSVFYTLLKKFLIEHRHNADLVLTKENVKFTSPSIKEVLTAKGLVKFAKFGSRRIQFCPYTIHNLISACLAKIQEEQKVNKLLVDKTIAEKHEIPLFGLYERLTEGDNSLADDYFNHLELQFLLHSTNVLYIMQLNDSPIGYGHYKERVNPVFRIGVACLQEFKARLLGHDSYNSKLFQKFHSIYVLKKSDHIDSETLENNFFMQAALLLDRPKIEIKRMGKGLLGVDFESIEQIDEIFDSCLKNPDINYGDLIQKFTNKNALLRLNRKS